MVRDSSKRTVAQERGQGRRLGGRMVWIKELDTLVTGTGQQFLIRGPAQPFDNALVCLCVPCLVVSSQIPDLDHTISASTGEMVERIWILGHRVHPIYMAITHLSQEWSSKHPLQLGGIQGPSVFSSSFKRMLGGIEVPRLSDNCRSRSLLRGRRPRQGFYFLLLC